MRDPGGRHGRRHPGCGESGGSTRTEREPEKASPAIRGGEKMPRHHRGHHSARAKRGRPERFFDEQSSAERVHFRRARPRSEKKQGDGRDGGPTAQAPNEERTDGRGALQRGATIPRDCGAGGSLGRSQERRGIRKRNLRQRCVGNFSNGEENPRKFSMPSAENLD